MNSTARAAALIGALVVVGGAAVAAAYGIGGPDPGAGKSSSAGLPPATTPVTRATLTQTQQVAGTLGYGPSTAILAAGPGRITWLPDLGVRVSRGQPVYGSDGVAVSLFYGGLPPYRALRSGDTGADVKEIEENLAALG